MIIFLIYIIMIAISTYVFYLSGIYKIDFYDLYSLFFIYNHIEYKMLIFFIVLYGITLSIIYWIKTRYYDSKLVFLATFLSAMPFLMLSLFIFDYIWFMVFLVTTILLSYMVYISVVNEEKIYKIIPHDKLSIKLFKEFLLFSFLIFAVLITISSYSKDNSTYINKMIYNIGKINITDIDNFKRNLIDAQKNSVLAIANSSLILLMNEILQDGGLTYNEKVLCIKAIETNQKKVLTKINNEINNHVDSAYNNNFRQLDKIYTISQLLIKAYPFIIGFYIYLLLDFILIFFSIVSQTLIKIYKFVYPNKNI